MADWLYMFLYMFGLLRCTVFHPTRERGSSGLCRGRRLVRPYQAYRRRSALERHLGDLAGVIGGVLFQNPADR